MARRAIDRACDAATPQALRAAGLGRTLAYQVIQTRALPKREGYAARVARALETASGVPAVEILSERDGSPATARPKRRRKPSTPAPPHPPAGRVKAAPAPKPRREPRAPAPGANDDPGPAQAARLTQALKLRREKLDLDLKEMAMAKALGELMPAEDVMGCHRAAGVELRKGLEGLTADVLMRVAESDRPAVRDCLEAGAEAIGARVEAALAGERA